MVFFSDPVYFVILVVTLVISGGAQVYIKTTFSKWDKVQNSGAFTACR